MSVVKINAITVPRERFDEFARRFATRAGRVSSASGFEGFELLRPNDEREVCLVFTRWRSEDDFRAWLGSQDFAAGHAQHREAARWGRRASCGPSTCSSARSRRRRVEAAPGPTSRPAMRQDQRMSILDGFRLDDKVAIVTGASSGLGVEFADALADAGADVAICARRAERLEDTKARVEGHGRRCLAIQADVAQVEDCQRVVEQTVAELGRVDVLVNNAGLGTAVPATREDPDEFRKVIDINLNGSYWMAQACGRAMESGSSIVNIGSVLGSTTAALPQAAYSASKAAIIGLTRDLAQQWTGRKGIRVNALAPGFFHSEMTEHYPEGYLDQMMWRIPTGRVGEGPELAAAAVFLASDAASYITGVLLPVDGGMLTT